MKILFILFIVALCSSNAVWAQPQTVYKGRVEEIYFSPNVKMPLELQAVTGTLDPEAIRKKLAPQILRAELKSFPVTLRGEWKGTLKVKAIEFSPEFARALPDDAAFDKEFFYVGRNMDARFRFYMPSAGRVSMDAPEIKTEHEEVNKKTGKSTRGILYLSTGHTEKEFDSNSRTAHSKDSLLFNKVNLLGDNTAEQNTYTLVKLVNKTTKRESKFYAEHVFSFKKLAAFQMNVKVAEVEYGPDGKWWKKMVLEGTLH